MIPDFIEFGSLPPGIHTASLAEFKERFVRFDRSDCRVRIFKKFEKLIAECGNAEIVRRVLVAGSYITTKTEPNDFDCLIVLSPAIQHQKLRPFEYRFVSRRTARRIFGGDVVAVIDESGAYLEYMEFFQTDRFGRRVGIVELEL